MAKEARLTLRRVGALLGRVEARALLLWGGAAGALWAFLRIADEMAEGETGKLDRNLLLALRRPGAPSDPVGPRWFEEAMRDVTALGGNALLLIIVITALASLLFNGKRRHALVLASIVALAQVSSEVLKAVYDRPRPTLVPHGAFVYSASFPSGHSTMSATVYLSLAAIVAGFEPTRRAKAFAFAMAGLIIVAVGFSRVYLGVHWPSDVLAGWALGSLWALAAFIWLRRIARREASPRG